MDCFIKKIIEKKVDEKVHKHFVRFSKGKFEKKFMIGCFITEKIKLNGSFEWANDFVEFVSEIIEKVRVSGLLLTKEKLDFVGKEGKELNEYNIEKEMSREEIKELIDKAYACLFNIEQGEISLKIKKKLPKLGKSGNAKVDDKFCVLELPLQYKEKVRECFFPDISSFKKVKIEHTLLIEEIIIPENEKDFDKIRLLAKKKGKLIRKVEIDSKNIEKEYEFEA